MPRMIFAQLCSNLTLSHMGNSNGNEERYWIQLSSYMCSAKPYNFSHICQALISIIISPHDLRHLSLPYLFHRNQTPSENPNSLFHFLPLSITSKTTDSYSPPTYQMSTINPSPNPNLTAVLVPGAWHSPSHYEPLLSLLPYPTYSARLPSVGSTTPNTITCQTDTTFIREKMLLSLLNEGRDILLILHSLGRPPRRRRYLRSQQARAFPSRSKRRNHRPSILVRLPRS